MKRFVAIMIVISFLAAGCTPSAMRAVALGGVLGTVAVLGISSHFRDRTSISAKKDVDIEHIKASAVSGAKVSCGDEPCENSYESSTAGSATVRHRPIAQPITFDEPRVRPLVSHKRRFSSDGSSLYRAGRRAAREGMDMNASCAGSRDDYCRGYNAAKEER